MKFAFFQKLNIFQAVLITFFTLVILAGAGTYAQLLGFDYPVRTPRITSLFGESRGDHFHGGIDFGIRQPVFPIAEGTVLFIKEEKHMRDFPGGVGNTVVIAHPNAIRSYYYHLENNSIPSNMSQVTPQTSIGIVGNTGYSLGAHLHLNIEDTQHKRLVNPLTVLPPIVDRIKPVITSFFFKINEKLYPIRKRNTHFRYLGPIQLYTVALDYLTAEDKQIGRRIGLQSLTLQVDRNIVRRYDFKYANKQTTGLVLDNNYSFTDVYGLPFNYKLGTFIPTADRHLFEIVARDWQDNVTIAAFDISFRN